MRKSILYGEAATALLLLASGAAGQTAGPAKAAIPPKLLVLVYQKFPAAKMAAREQWEKTTARLCRELSVPNSWILLESITGEPVVLSFDPFDSFAHIARAFAEWGPLYASHPELGRLQAQIKGALASERTLIAVEREDLSYRANQIDLSKARFLRVLEVRLHPGRENEFAESFQKLSRAYEKTQSELYWVVYQVNAGAPSPTFFAFVPMRTLSQNDDLLNLRGKLREAEGEDADRMQQIAEEAYAGTESDLYFITPDKSVVSNEFAAGDREFWTPEPRPAGPPAPRKGAKPQER